MRTVHKYTLSIGDIQSIKVPGLKGAESIKEQILHVDSQGGQVCMWCLVDKEEPENTLEIYLIPTGGLVPEHFTKDDFLGTIKLMNDCIVLHMFMSIQKTDNIDA